MRTTVAAGSRRVVRRSVALSLLVVLLIGVGATAVLAQATALGGKLRNGEQVTISVGEVVEGDLYVTGGIVRVEGTVTGDLLVIGGQVDVLGDVRSDLMVAGGTVDVTGPVGGDVRAAGGQLSISGPVGEDLFVAGGQVTVTPSAEIGEDLVFGVGQMVLDGTVAGDVLGSAGDYTRRGTIGGTENVTVAEPERRVPTTADRVLAALQRYVSLLAVAALALWLAPRLIHEPASVLRRRPLTSLGLGVLALAAVLVVVVIVIIGAVLLSILLGLAGLTTLVGATVFTTIVALITLAFLLFLALTFGAPAGVGMALGDLVFGTRSATRRWLSLVLGLAVVVAITSIPVIGGLLSFFVVTFGLGAILLALNPRRVPPEGQEPQPDVEAAGGP